MRKACLAACALAITGLATVPADARTMVAPDAATVPSHYQNFRAAIYIAVNDARALADRATFDRQYARAASQLHFDKVYIEAYRDHNFATDAELERVKSYFREKGVAVAGGVTLAAGGKNGQFGTFDYELPEDRAECERAVRLAAKHFDEVILDDFFFYTSKSDADIAAKGKRSWTQYRLDTMRDVARNLVLKPAKAVNPNVRMIIKYPNWYEHFQGLGYDLDQEAKAFDGIYTGTETRDPTLTDQLLQEYESYEIIRYYDNIRPGANGGGWVDTFSTRFIDRYAEQLWDTLFAKAPEITLFNWHPMSQPEAVDSGDRPWKNATTSFDWDREQSRWAAAHPGTPAGWGRAAGYALETIDPILGALGKPVGIASYKPYQSSGEDFLHNFLGNLGIPVELQPTYPTDAKTVLLTEAAAADSDIVAKIEASLRGGADVIVTSGLVAALHDKGFADLAEWTPTGRIVSVSHFVQGFGAGNGKSLDDDGAEPSSMLIPETRFYTNDSWATIRAVAGKKGYPVLLMNHYSKGTLYMLTVPENQSDLYRLPQAALTQIRSVVGRHSPVVIDAPAGVALFTYDNGAIVVQNYSDTAVDVGIGAEGATRLDAIGGAAALKPQGEMTGMMGDTRPAFATTIPPHSFKAYRIAR
ncbi:hypothetical protein [Stakelama marina]|uniref:Uncharacterized protein n=1 Tax=Stakelama marina TaxID=2826939 RepID=A0A8T4II78_9SPHN|nr:hypothetical protein [Stakelama marina]MBR0552795.1 hypothetical protein [Stakelama marina]